MGFKLKGWSAFSKPEPVSPLTDPTDKIKKKHQNIYKLTKPDIDNYIKFYMDCFNDKIWEDDSQVINISSSKRYSNSEPKTEVHIYQLN